MRLGSTTAGISSTVFLRDLFLSLAMPQCSTKYSLVRRETPLHHLGGFMDRNMYDFRTWTPGGRDQLRKCLLRGHEMYLERCLKGEVPSKKAPSVLLAELLAVRQKLNQTGE